MLVASSTTIGTARKEMSVNLGQSHTAQILPASRDDFEIAVLCALPHEAAAVRALFDQIWPERLGKAPNDPNAYTAGVMAGHPVVLVHLAQMGTNSAATAAQACRHSFPRIRLALVVGVCGGVPQIHGDLFLGDVVISDSVVQPDFGRNYGDQVLPKADTLSVLGRPNLEVRTFLNKLRIQAEMDLVRTRLAEYLILLANNPNLQAYFPGTETDRLFQPSYVHKHQSGCFICQQSIGAGSVCEQARHASCAELACNSENLVFRRRNVAPSDTTHPLPNIRIGAVASSNGVIKSGDYRDQLGQSAGVIAFEMESAGIWDIFPCLVVKGVCDYADSHKNKIWQHYAAATAASCAKALLLQWDSTSRLNVQHRLQISEHLAPVPAAPVFPALESQTSRDATVASLSSEQHQEMMKALRFQQMDARLLTLRSAQTKTCRWLTKTPLYQEWTNAENLHEHHGFFWIKGKPGTGKSVMMKFLVGEARRTMRGSLILPFFFNARGGELEKSTLGLYRSLLWQLLDKAPETRTALDCHDGSIYSLVKDSGWQSECLKDVLGLAIRALKCNKRVVCFVDALDECPEDEVRSMVSFFEELGRLEKSAELRICFSSRHYPEISIRTGLHIILEQNPSHTDDISIYTDANLNIMQSDAAGDIRAEIIRKSSGVFLWVALVIPMLNKAYDRGRIKALKKKLHELPEGLHELFNDMLTRDNNNVDELRSCVRFILYAAQPLTSAELLSAVEIETEHEGALPPPYQPADDAETYRRRLVDISKGLAEITISDQPTVQFIHESVRDFLINGGGLQKVFSLAGNFEALSHERLKELCLLHIRSGVTCDSSKCTRGISHSCYPLRQYAVRHILSHANSAQEQGIDQDKFLSSDFELNSWLWMSTPRGRRTLRRSTNADILYFLAEDGHAALIRSLPDVTASLEIPIKSGKYRFPIVGALFAGKVEAAYALLSLPLSNRDMSHVPERRSSDTQMRLLASNYQKGRPAISYLCEYGDPVLLEAALNLNIEIDHVKAKWCVLMTTSEAVTELLARSGIFGALVNRVSVRPHEYLQQNLHKARQDLYHEIKQIPPLLFRVVGLGSKLEWAAQKGFVNIAMVCSENADIRELASALHSAATGTLNPLGRYSIIEFIFEACAQFSGVIMPREVTFSLAMDQPHNERVFKLLLERSSQHMIDLEVEMPVLLYYAIRNNRKAYVRMLLEAGADPNGVLYTGHTSLTWSVKLLDYSTISLLCRYGRTDINTVDQKGYTALLWCAAMADDTDAQAIGILIGSGKTALDPNFIHKSGQTALIRAVRSGNIKIVRLLLEMPGIDPGLGRCGGLSPLQLAVRLCRWNSYRCYWEICRLLLVTGRVGPDARCRRTKSALEMAEDYGLTELVTLMKTYKECQRDPRQMESLEPPPAGVHWPHLQVIQKRWLARQNL